MALEDNPADQFDLIEAQIVSQAQLPDFNVLGVQDVTDVSAVFETCCTLPGLPRPLKRYALKVMLASAAHPGESGAMAGLPEALQQEWLHSNALPPHPNIVRVLRVGVHGLPGVSAAVLAALCAGEAIPGSAAALGKRGAQVAWDVPCVRGVLLRLPDVVKAALVAAATAAEEEGEAEEEGRSAASGRAATGGPAVSAPSSGSRPRGGWPGLAFSVAECATASLTAARATVPGVLPFSALFPMALQLSRALAHAHAFRVVHRDLHPGNVLLLPPSAASSSAAGGTASLALLAATAPRFALCDWGAAARVPDDTFLLPYAGGAGQAIGGALAFLPPEVLVAAAQSARAATAAAAATNEQPPHVGGGGGGGIPYAKSDVWGLAALLHTAATGVHPWPGYPVSLAASVAPSTSSSSTAAAAGVGRSLAHLSSNPLWTPPPLPAEFPLYFRELLRWALRPQPAQRLTIRAFAARCEELATGAVPRALPTRLFPWLAGAPPPLPGAAAGALLEASAAASVAAGAGARPGAPTVPSAEGWAVVLVRSLEGLTAAVPAYLGPPAGSGLPASGVPEATFGDILAAATEMLPAGRIAGGAASLGGGGGVPRSRAAAAAGAGYALLHGGRLIDPGVPVRLLLHVFAASYLTLAPGAAHLPPTLTVAGYGVLRPVAAVAAVVAAAAPPLPPLPPGAAVADRGDGPMSAVAPPLPAGPPPGAAAAPASGRVEQPLRTLAPAPAAAPVSPAVPVPAAASGGGAAAVAAAAAAAAATAAVAAAASISGGSSGATGAFAGRGLAPLYAFSEHDKGPAVALSASNTAAFTRDKWTTVLLAHPAGGISERSHGSGAKYSFAVQILQADSGAGCAVGFADVSGAAAAAAAGTGGGGGGFDPLVHNLGAHPGSWAYSKTGKVSNGRPVPPPPPAPGAPPPPPSGTVWAEYGEVFGAGDLLVCEVEPAAGRMRFFKNGVPQGTAFVEPELRAATLRPAVCIGSNSGGRAVRVQLVTPPVREFERAKSHHRIQFSDDCTAVFNSGKWATSLASHSGVLHGRTTWSLRLDDTRHGAGVAVGVVDAEKFDWEKQNLGASPGSWCFSKTGKVGDGNGFTDYGRPFSCGDVISVTLDMDKGELSFGVNGEDQGIAYDASASIGTRPLVPAVCLGSTEGNKLARVSLLGPLGPAPLRRFDRYNCSPKLKLTDCFNRVETADKWGTVFLDSPGASAGKLSFAVLIVSAGQGCGAGLGFADARQFKPASRNLGAADASWCYSKTGKRSSGAAGFEAYGTPFKTGDVVSAEVDLDEDTLRFYVNGRDQGAAFTGGFRDRQLVPAVVLGSSDGGHLTQLALVPPCVTRLDPRRCNKHITLSAIDRAAATDYRWSSALADHPGASAGAVRFAVRLEGEGGAAVGFAEATAFRPYMHNLGASAGTWALSKTGKKSAGDTDGFTPYCDKLSAGEVIGCEADLTEGTIRFWRNGVHLGAAFTGLAGRGLTLVPAVCIGSNSGGKNASVTVVEFEQAWVLG